MIGWLALGLICAGICLLFFVAYLALIIRAQ